MAGIVGIVATGIDAATQYWIDGRIDAQQLLAMGGLGVGSTVAGNYVGTQASLLLTKYSTVLGRVGGTILGGSAGSVVFAYGMYATGHIDLRTANIIAATGLGTTAIVTPIAYALAYKGAMTIALTYGTASTGTAISTLSGAAATKAAAAWLGGGSLATGGGGMAAAGSSILVTGGTVLIVAAVVTPIAYGFHLKNVRDEHIRLTVNLAYTHERIRAGNQPEWQ